MQPLVTRHWRPLDWIDGAPVIPGCGRTVSLTDEVEYYRVDRVTCTRCLNLLDPLIPRWMRNAERWRTLRSLCPAAALRSAEHESLDGLMASRSNQPPP